MKLRSAFDTRAPRTSTRRNKTAALALFVCATFPFVCANAQTSASVQNRAGQSAGANGNVNQSVKRWTRVASGSFAHLRAVFFLDKQTGWAAGGAGAILATKDGGATWQKLVKPPTEDTIRDIFFADAQTGLLLCERNIYKMQTVSEPYSYLLRTTDAGVTWTRVDVGAPGVRLWRFAFANTQNGWTFGESGALFATTDGGASWARQRVAVENLLLGASFTDGQTGWVVGGGASVVNTVNGGATWRISRAGAASNQTNSNQSSSANNTGAASRTNNQPAGNGQLVSRIIREVPQRERDQTTAKLYAVSFVDTRFGWAVGAHGTIYQTINGGATWRTQNSNTDAALFDVKFADNSRGWAVGASGTLLETGNGGATWTNVKTDTTHNLERIHIGTRGEMAVAVGFGGTIFRLSSDDQTPNNTPRLRTGN